MSLENPKSTTSGIQKGPTTSGTQKVTTGASRKGQAPSPPTQKVSTTSVETVQRSCTDHNFLTDVADVRQMEKGLLRLLEDFHNGKLQVFGKECTFEQMDQMREQQERLSRLHFDLDAQQQLYNIDGDDAKDMTFKNLDKLVENLDDLSKAVHSLKNGAIPPNYVPTHSQKEEERNRESTS